jgi:hypothetical protein
MANRRLWICYQGVPGTSPPDKAPASFHTAPKLLRVQIALSTWLRSLQMLNEDRPSCVKYVHPSMPMLDKLAYYDAIRILAAQLASSLW